MVFLGREISEQKDYSERTALLIDKEVDKIIKEAQETALQILTDNKDKLIKVAETLMDRETIEGEELEELFDSLMGTTKDSGETAKAEATASVEEVTQKPARKRTVKKPPIIPDPLQDTPPPIPDSP